MATEDELKALRLCEKEDCEHKIPNGEKELKDNCLKSANSNSCGVSGSSGFSSKKKSCGNCNTKSHNEAGFSEEARKKHCKAYNFECGKC